VFVFPIKPKPIIMNLHNNIDRSALEERLQQKLEQYAKAEDEGKPNTELIEIYKELKDLRYQITFSGPGARFRNQSTSSSNL
jgi:uncharacterized membrane protein YgaE (UPF0421/DUF939 family)